MIEIIDSPLGLALTNDKPDTTTSDVLYKRYKLRRKSDGMYSTGGTHVRWSAKGKEWATLAALSGHLAQHKGGQYAQTRQWKSGGYGYGGNSNYDLVGTEWNDVEIVTLEIRENVAEAQDAKAYVDGMRDRAQKRKVQAEARKAKSKIEAAKKEIEVAQKRLQDLNTQFGF